MATFLVIDDSKLARSKQEETIKSAGHEVVGSAENGQEGVEKYKELSPDFVTLDLEMPVLNGLDATKAIIAHDANAKIIIVSSVVNKTAITDVLNAGALFNMKKPFKSEMLQRQIARYIEES